MSESAKQRARADVIAMATAFALDNVDPTILDSPALQVVMDDLELAKPLDVALPAASLLTTLARELGQHTDELPEDILQRIGLAAALNPIEPREH